MKWLVFILLPLMFFGQENELRLYLPVRTYHYDRTPDHEYHPTEGGNLGVIAIYRIQKEKWFEDIIGGVIHNSYGNLSLVAQYGLGKSFGKFQVSGSIGIMTGYKHLFDPVVEEIWLEHVESGELCYCGEDIKYSRYQQYLPGFMKNNGIIIMPNLHLSYDTGILSPLLIISPEYINAWIAIDIL